MLYFRAVFFHVVLSGVDTYGGGQGGGCVWGRGRDQCGGGRRQDGRNGGNILPAQSDINACTNITKTYYTGANYKNFVTGENQKVCQNQRKYNHKVSDAMSASEMYRNIYKISTHVENQGKRVCDIERADDDSSPNFTDDDEDTNILRDYIQNS